MRKHYPRPPDQLSLQQQAKNENHPRSDWCFGCWWRDVDDVPLLHCFELGLWLINVFFIYSADYFLNQWISFSFKWNPRMILIFFFLNLFYEVKWIRCRFHLRPPPNVSFAIFFSYQFYFSLPLPRRLCLHFGLFVCLSSGLQEEKNNSSPIVHET